MWLIDYAEDFSKLTQAQIYSLVKKGILLPQKKHHAFYFSFQDIMIMRTFKLLKANGLSYLNVEKAYEYLRTLKEDEPLTSFVLYHDKKDVYTKNEREQMLNATKQGQLVLAEAMQLLPLGMALEETRVSMWQVSKRLVQMNEQSFKESIPSGDLESWLAS